MKRLHLSKALGCLYALLFYHSDAFSQCANSAPASIISYDTVIHGGGNTIYDLNFPQFDTSKIYLNFPQFDPSKGTLIAVDLQTIISVKNSYKLENQDNISSLSKIKIVRSDIINSTALITPFQNDKNKIIAINILSPNDGMNGSGTDYVEAGPIYAYRNYAINYNLTNNLAGFLGDGNILINYETQTDLYSSGSNNLFTSITEDSIYFKLVYYYCLTSILPADITDFNATKSTNGNLQLRWNAPNDRIGNKYEMQKSLDGIRYVTFNTIPAKSAASNSYQVYYTPAEADKDKIFFRIKQYDAGGDIKYSMVKTIQLEYLSPTMKLYPTVSKNNVNIYFPYAIKSDYLVSILSISGQAVQQSVFSRTNFIKLPLNPSLKPGLYLVTVLNKQTLALQQAKLVIE